MARVKTLKWIGLVVVALAVIGYATDSGEDNRGRSQPPTYVDPYDESTGSWSAAPSAGGVEIVAERSECDQAAAEARIYVVFTLRNHGSSAEEVNIMARRRYSDGTSNDSIMDVMTVTVPANSTERFYGSFDYNAEKHLLIECYLHFAGSSNEIPVAVT